VSQVVTALQDHGADAALGGSGLLAALGLVDAVRDWDVTTDADPAVVEAALQSIGATYDIQTGGDGPYRSRARFVVAASDRALPEPRHL
jgi:hypothetical protein